MKILAALFAFQIHAESLRLVSPAKSELKNPIDVQFAIEGNTLYARFAVKAKKLNVNPKPKSDEPPYQNDVVEVFVSVSGNERSPYYEYELSPLNQTYTVRVEDPKKPFKEGLDLGLQSKTTPTNEGWIGEMWIPLDRIGYNGDPKTIYGNFYAIQGFPPRSFWSLWLPPAKKAKFHQPEFFRQMF